MNHGGGNNYEIQEGVPFEAPVEVDLVERFQQRCIELARTGTLGSLRTRKSSLQSTWAHLLSLLDQPQIPILVYGEKGTGKRKLIDEFLTLQNFCRRIGGVREAKLKVFGPDFIKEGFSALFLEPHLSCWDVVYFEKVDQLTEEHQEELLSHLKLRKHFADKGTPLPRIIFSTERALSLLMIQKQFSRELFQALTGFAVFLPSLNERPEDLPELIQSMSGVICGKRQLPKSYFVDILSRHMWPENMDELHKFLKSALAKNSDMSTWTEKDLPLAMRPHTQSSFVRISKEQIEAQSAEKTRLQQALVSNGGDRVLAAKSLKMPKGELLSRLMALGLR